MKIKLSKAHELITDARVIARDGENNSEVLITTIDNAELLNKNCYIEFEKDNGSKFTTPRLEIVDGVVAYALENGLFDGTAYLKIQYVFRDDNYCWKSFVKKFKVHDSINAEDNYPSEYPSFISEAQRTLTEIQDIYEEVKVLRNNVQMMESAVYAPTEIQGSFLTRTTANGENIIDGAYAQPKILGGRTIKVDGEIFHAIVGRIVERKGSVTDTLEIPNEVEELDCYGAGLSDTNKDLMNYIDFEREQYVQNIKKVNAWEMNWTYNSTLRYFTTYGINSDIVIHATNSTKGNILSSHFKTDTYTHIYGDAPNYDNCVGVVVTPQSSTGSVCVSKQQYTDVASFIQFLRDNNVVFYYQSKTPITTDITLPKKKLQAFRNGQESLENANNVPAYLETIYRISKI